MFSAEALSFRQQSRLAISLSLIGGFTNVVAFLVWKTFASHMTGASTLIGLNGARTDWRNIKLSGVLVMSFLFGAIAAALMTELVRRRGALSKYMLPLSVEALLLTSVMISLRMTAHSDSGLTAYALLGLTAFAMGLQNATITKISGAVVRSTHLTGVITDFGIESVQLGLWMWDQLRGRIWQRSGRILRVSQRHPTFLRVLLLASIWASFVLGAAIGAFTYGRFHELCLLGPIALLIFMIFIDWLTPIADIRELDVLHDPELKLYGIIHSIIPPELGVYRVTHDHRKYFRSPNFNLWLDRLPAGKRIIILMVSPVMTFDATALLNLQRAVDTLEAAHRRLIIAGVTPAQYKKLSRARILQRIGPENVCPDIELAIGLGAELVRSGKQQPQ